MINAKYRRGRAVGLLVIVAAALLGTGAPVAHAQGPYGGPYTYIGDYINQDAFRYDEQTGAIDGAPPTSTTNAAYIDGVGGVEGIQLNCATGTTPGMLVGLNASGELYVFNPTTLALEHSFKAASGGVNIVFSTDGLDAYVADYSGNEIYEYTTASLLTDSSTANAIHSVAFTDPRELQVLANGDLLASQGADHGVDWTNATTPVANAVTGVTQFNDILGGATTIVAANTVASTHELDYETGLTEKADPANTSPDHDIFVASTGFYTDKNQFGGGSAVTVPDIINEYDSSGHLLMSLETVYAPQQEGTVNSSDLITYNPNGTVASTTATTALPQGIFGLQIGDDGNLYVGGFIAATMDKIDLTWNAAGDGGLGDYVMGGPSTYITPGEGGLKSVKYFSFSDMSMGECPEPSQTATLGLGVFGLMLLAFVRRRKLTA